VLLGATASRDAQACSLAPPVFAVEAPAEGAEGLPTNPVLWIPFDGQLERDVPAPAHFLLRAEDGREIELEVEHLGGDGLRVMTPLEALEPQTRHELWACSETECSAMLRSFTTGDEVDLEPPPLPVEHGRHDEVERRVGPCGGTYRWLELDIDFEGVLVVDLGVPEFDDELRTGRPDVVTTEVGTLVLDDDFTLTGDDVAARIGSFDAAGNFSGWTELAPLDLPGCGCRSHGGPGHSALLLLALLARRRRRASA
jgi:hypothetical protein